MDKLDKPVKLMFRNLDGEFRELDFTNKAQSEKRDFLSSFPSVIWRLEWKCNQVIGEDNE